MLLSSCASNGKENKIPEPTEFTVPMAAERSNTHSYPNRGDYVGAYLYAKKKMAEKKYREAATWFVKAVETTPGPTQDKIWEYENMINATYAWFLAGERDLAVETLKQAENYNVYAPKSDRAVFINVVLGDGDPYELPTDILTLLPYLITEQ